MDYRGRGKNKKIFKKISTLSTIILLSLQSTTFAVTNKDSFQDTALKLIRGMESDKIIEKSILKVYKY